MDVLDQDALNEYQNAMEVWFDIGDKVLSLLNENKREKHKRSFWKKVPALDKAFELVKPLSKETEQIRTKTMTESMDRTNKSLFMLMFMTAVAIAIGMWICLKVTKAIVKPVTEVVNAMVGIAKKKNLLQKKRKKKNPTPIPHLFFYSKTPHTKH